MNDFMDRATRFADQHDDQVGRAIGEAGEQADRRAGGRYGEQAGTGVDAARQRTGQGGSPR
ncbi:antitoxin [Dactylosporangium sp. CA-052675]|uniref:antitoxin n=1 Tax=Dactylosporangium sp. CA-052675 TaxID=3239927 RepID=UPI003D89F663